MIRDEWQWSTDPVRMLHFLRDRAGDRKLRLFALACCLHADRFPDSGSRSVLEMVSHYADGLIGPEELWSAFMLLSEVTGRRVAIPRPMDTNDARLVCVWCLGPVDQRGEAEAQCKLLRCIFG